MPGTTIQPYLFFAGRCEEALDFYHAALGAEVAMKLRFSDSPEPMPKDTLKPGFENKIMHAEFRVAGATVMASDGCGEGPAFAGFSLSLCVPSTDAAHRAFNALAAGGNVTMPLAKAFWSPCFGMVTDKFGVAWMVSVAHESR
jgi:PhnB protein